MPPCFRVFWTSNTYETLSGPKRNQVWTQYEENFSILRVYRWMKNGYPAESLRPLEANSTFASSLKCMEVIDRDGEFQVRGLRSYFQFRRCMLRGPNEASWLITRWPMLTLCPSLTFLKEMLTARIIVASSDDFSLVQFAAIQIWVVYRREISSKRFFHPWLSKRVVHW